MISNLSALGIIFSALGALGVSSAFGQPSVPRKEMGKIIHLSDPNVFLSPYCWRLDAEKNAICPASGGYLRFNITGTTRLSLSVNSAINSGLSALQMPTVKVVVNGPALDGPARYFQFPARVDENTLLEVSSGLDPTLNYRVLIQVIGGDERAMSGWSGTIFQTQINYLLVDAGARILPAILRPKRALFLGASYEQAFFGDLHPDAPVYTYVDASLSWPFFVAYGLDCEYGQVGIGSQGWVRHGNGGYPPFTDSWDHFDADHLKAFRDDLDYVFVHIAENDAAQEDAAVQRAVTDWIPKARAAFGRRARIFIVLSLPQIKSASIRAGVIAAGAPRTYILDPGTEFQHVVFSGGPTWASPGDGIHLDAIHQSIFTAFVIRQAQRCLEPSGVPSSAAAPVAP